MTECTPNCGACCDPVVLPYSVLDVIALGDRLDAETRRFVLEDLTPMKPRRLALQKASYLTQHGITLAIVEGKALANPSAFYSCRWFDPEARACTNYEGRPALCRDYPWYGDPPDRAKAIPQTCSYRADLGEVPVSITPKP